METPVLFARPDLYCEKCMAVMSDKRVRYLPVIDEGKLIGIISIGDLVKNIISDHKFTIAQLTSLFTSLRANGYFAERSSFIKGSWTVPRGVKRESPRRRDRCRRGSRA
jgi:signal-transduction protein with cAMP-binding, CBS, and nucleotidyltransferase domain